MDILDVFKLLGGVAFFLFGMSVMSGSLEKMSGGRLERTLERATSSMLKSLALGMGITVAIQSSSAMTVMLVGLVNSGIMSLHQTVGIIMGSNVGTTLTAWVLALTGINSENVLINLLKPENFSPLFAVVGIAMIMFSRKQKRRDVGEILIGFAVLMFGMTVMKDSVAGLAESEKFKSILVAFENPFLGVLVGAVFTGIIQSSAASVGLLQAFAITSKIKFGVAIPIIMGQNIGTCVTALLSSIGVNRAARRVAVVHVYFNLIGTALYIMVLYGLNALVNFTFMDLDITPLWIAVAHSIFNVSVTVVLLPFTRALERLALLTIRDKPNGVQKTEFLDERLLNTPAFAIVNCLDMVSDMCAVAKDAALAALALVGNYSERTAETSILGEERLDEYEDKLGTYLVKLSAKELSDRDSWEAARMLRAIGDLERIGDHALNIVYSAKEIHEKGIDFTGSARSDLSVLREALSEIVSMTTEAVTNRDAELAKKVEPLEQVIDVLVREARDRHIVRIQRGECGIAPGFVWSDLMVNYERMSDHCSNLAVGVIQKKSPSMGGHDYLSKARSADNPEFAQEFDAYSARYRLDAI
ncbi:MAG: Na/Pi cotransporter family protein [Oscillospiraceae bacterium]|jgi:phosphate:Na+ symporter|nr:Na/Pi cotransporter family protein [Oscillospiraceae bacterium]